MSSAGAVVPGAYSDVVIAALAEICLRCGAKMEWRQSTWQCPRCHFKLGCCEGECPND
jgi:Zn finger protein HypA/HybF involved in hydrogenase expression